MKYIKLFENFNQGTMKMSFGSEDFEEFLEEVTKWKNETGSDVRWSLFTQVPEILDTQNISKMRRDSGLKEHPNPERAISFQKETWEESKQKTKYYWDMYVKGDNQFHVVEFEDKLIGILTDGNGNVLKAFDNMDHKFDLQMAQELIG